MKKLISTLLTVGFLIIATAVSAGYSLSSNPTTQGANVDPPNWGTNILTMTASLTGGNTLSISVSKTDGGTFNSSGTMFLRVEHPTTGSTSTTSSVSAGITQTVTFSSINLLSSWTYPRKYYAYYQSEQSGVPDGGWAWVGPITVYATGDIQINIMPTEAVNAGAKWETNIPGVGWTGPYNSGNTITGFPLGNGSIGIRFTDIAGWNTPAQTSVNVQVNQTATTTGTYTQTGTNCSQVTQIPTSECDALVALYDSTDGDNWTNKTGWKVTTTPCSWSGIRCTGGHVTQIYPDNNNLTGSLPSELNFLTALEYLSLKSNKLSGSIPNLTALKALKILWLTDNQLSGSIPDLSELSSLNTIYLENNRLSGGFPILSVSTQHLNLSSNQLSGNIPISLLTNLIYLHDTLDLSYNKLTASHAAVISFLSSKDSDWENTQTVPPTNVNATALSTDTIQVEWTPIAYTNDGGYYQVKYATTSGGPYTNVSSTTTNKSATSYDVTGLTPGTTYYFVVETFTPKHGSQQNDLTSILSTEASATTNSSFPALPMLAWGSLTQSGQAMPIGTLVTYVINGTELLGTIDVIELGQYGKRGLVGGDIMISQFTGKLTFRVNGVDVASANITPFASNPPACSSDANNITFAEGTNCRYDIVLPNPDCAQVIEIPQAECEVLVALYDSTDGPNWSDSPANNWKITNTPCSWMEVTCSGGHVTNISRVSRNLSGNLPDLSALTALVNFNLNANQVSGNIPDLTAFPALRFFNLGVNKLTGSIPDLSALTALEIFNLNANQVSGNIPDLSMLSSLRFLDLSINQLTGTIPKLSTLKALTDINLSGNKLSGNIPNLSTLINLKSLSLCSNQLTGNIPDLSNLVNLWAVDLCRNQLTGSIPDLSSLTKLISFNVPSNQLSGKIPDLSRLTALTSTNLGYNKFTDETAGTATAKDPDWKDTQTVPPTNLTAKALSDNTVQVTWTRITYTSDGGYYRIKYDTQSGEPYPNEVITENKKTASYNFTGLTAGTYYFVVETFTPKVV